MRANVAPAARSMKNAKWRAQCGGGARARAFSAPLRRKEENEAGNEAHGEPVSIGFSARGKSSGFSRAWVAGGSGEMCFGGGVERRRVGVSGPCEWVGEVARGWVSVIWVTFCKMVVCVLNRWSGHTCCEDLFIYCRNYCGCIAVIEKTVFMPGKFLAITV